MADKFYLNKLNNLYNDFKRELMKISESIALDVYDEENDQVEADEVYNEIADEINYHTGIPAELINDILWVEDGESIIVNIARNGR